MKLYELRSKAEQLEQEHGGHLDVFMEINGHKHFSRNTRNVIDVECISVNFDYLTVLITGD